MVLVKLYFVTKVETRTSWQDLVYVHLILSYGNSADSSVPHTLTYLCAYTHTYIRTAKGAADCLARPGP